LNSYVTHVHPNLGTYGQNTWHHTPGKVKIVPMQAMMSYGGM